MRFILFCLGVFSFAIADEIPTSTRSLQAIARVKTKLEKDLATQDLRMGAPLFIRIFKESSHFEVWLQKDTDYVLFNGLVFGVV